MAATEMRSIADACSKQLELLVKVNDTVQYNKADNWDSNELSVDEHLARFRMWAGNIGVFAEAHASLDHRLKDNEGAKQLMVNFLVTLRTFLQRGQSQPAHEERLLTTVISSRRVTEAQRDASRQ